MTTQEDFSALLREFEKEHAGTATPAPVIGDKVRGRVISIQGDYAFVDLGAKTEGAVEIAELTDADGNLSVAIGDPIEIIVSGKDEDSGTLLLGARHARRAHGSEGLRQAYEQQTPVEGRVSGVLKGGVEVEISGERAFCPASQIDIQYVEDLQSYVGEKLAFRITKFESGRSTNLVVSRRALLEEERQTLAADTRNQLAVGAVLNGRVSSIRDFGAFIDLGGVEGMVHISELSFGRVEHPQDILAVGQAVEVSVLRIEKTNNPKQPEKIALSIRALEKDPWRDVLNDYPVGTSVPGKVVRIQAFGAFVELAPGVDGLVHISEMSDGRRINHPQELLSVGDRVQATVLNVDTEKRRISLSLKDARKQEMSTNPDITPELTKPKQSFGTLGDLLKASMKKQK
ncbi:MAG: 30S ribosomal protein S1 [Gammaproteobacteria bacterium]|nr:30S ribosomal protein S1 [Gammaproteobacteria bacterium]